MEDEIIEKLKVILSSKITKECETVYIMVEIRKILENNDNNLCPLLRFYCNWVCHSKINNLSAVRDILNKIYEEHKKGGFNQANLDFLNFIHLRKEMKDFFIKNNLPIKLLENEKDWRVFIKLLANIIKDCPLEIHPNYKPVFIEKFILTEYKDEIDEDGFWTLHTSWQYKPIDNKTTFNCSLTEKDMRNHNLESRREKTNQNLARS